MHYRLSVIILSIFFITGCTAVISEKSRKLVNTDVPFKILKNAPEDYIGKNLMVGGRIAGVTNKSDGAWLEIVQFDLSSQGYPEESFLSYGRFLATENSYMDPMIFRRGMLITIVGELKGKKTLRLDEMDYTYPVLAMREWHLWPGSEPEGRCTAYPAAPPQYDPYNYGFGYEPFLERPYTPLYLPR
jgi:outer membrane lipoprotein